MPVTAKLRYLRIAPRKVRLVVDLIRGKSIEEAQTILNFTLKKAALPLSKLLKSAIANAENNFQLDKSNLYISKIIVDEGPKLKRWQMRARGRAYEIQKKTSHVTIVLDEIKEKGISKKIRRLGKIKKIEKVMRKKRSKEKKAKLKAELELAKPKMERGLKRIFRRKAF